MDIRDSPPPVGEEDLREFERQHGLALPEDYKQFLLRHNGGVPEPSSFRFAGSEGGSLVQCLYGIGPAVPYYARLERTIEVFADRMPPGVIAVGSDPFGNQVCMATSGPRTGTVYFWDHEKEAGPSYTNMSLVAETFDEFLAGLFVVEAEFFPASELHLLATRLRDAAEAARSVIRLLPGSEMARHARRILEEPGAGRVVTYHAPENFCSMVPVMISQPGAPVSARDVAAAERKIGVAFPPAYRRFLLEFNGGSPEPNSFWAKDGTDAPPIGFFYEIGGGEFAGLVERVAEERAVPRGMIPVGLGGMADLACLQISGPRVGAVYHIGNAASHAVDLATGEQTAPRLLADDFDELLRRGYDNERDPCWQFGSAVGWLEEVPRLAAELIQRAPGTAEAGAARSLLDTLESQGLAAAATAAEAMPGVKGPP